MPVDIDGVAGRLVSQIEAVESELNAELRRILNDPRWASRVGRLRNLLSMTDAAKDEIITAGRLWVNGPFRDVYVLAATEGAARLGGQFAWTQFHREAFTMLGTDTYGDVLAATQFMGDDVKQIIRSAGQVRAAAGEIAGRTALQSADLLRKDLLDRGLTAVTYRNGARYGVGTYSRMLMRTKTALARNLGSMVQYREMGVEYLECLDSEDCGLGAHHDPAKANGLVLPINEAAGYPISHPNCVRDWIPRPDVTSQTADQAKSLLEDDRRADQRRFEEYLKAERLTREGRIMARTPRSPRGARSARLPRDVMSARNPRGRTPTPEELISLDAAPTAVAARSALAVESYEQRVIRELLESDRDDYPDWSARQHLLTDEAGDATSRVQEQASQITGSAAEDYGHHGYREMNEYLRRGAADDPRMTARVNEIVDQMSEVEREFTVARTYDSQYLPDLAPGAVVEDAGIMSSSLRLEAPVVIPGSGSNSVLVIRVPEGARAGYLSTSREAEVLFPPGTRLRIIEVLENVNKSGPYGRRDFPTTVFAEVVV